MNLSDGYNYQKVSLWLVYMGFFGLGLNFYWVYLPALLLGLPLLVFSSEKIKGWGSEHWIAIGLLLYLFLLFFFGWQRFLWDNTLKSAMVGTFFLLSPLVGMFCLKQGEFEKAFSALFAGMLCFVAIGALYTFFFKELDSARGQVWLPWDTMPRNSPAFANLAALVAVFILIIGAQRKKYNQRLLIWGAGIVLAGCFVVAQYLDARSFYAALIVSLPLLFWYSNWKRVVALLIGAIALNYAGGWLLGWLADVVGGVESVDSAISLKQETPIESDQQQGRGSFFLRFFLWAEGIQLLFQHPWGGFRPAEVTPWFHNLWIDTASTSGILPVIVLCMLNTGTVIQIFQSRGRDMQFKSLIVVQVTCLALMFQDVVIEGNIRLLSVYMLAVTANFRFYSNEKESAFGARE